MNIEQNTFDDKSGVQQLSVLPACSAKAERGVDANPARRNLQ